MSRNEGGADRFIRIVVGVVLLVATKYIATMSVAWWVLIVVGAIGLITGILGWCPLYKVLGISTAAKAAPPKTEPQNPTA